MPKQSKPKTDAPVETVSAVESSAPVEKKVKAPKKSSESKSSPATAPVVTPVVATPAPVATPAVQEPETDETVGQMMDLISQSTEFLAKLNQANVLVASLKADFRSLEKKWTREIKIAQKSQAKRKRKSGNRQPSGFVKPTKISDELAKFLDKSSGTEMARTEVTREINKYIRTHNLQDKENGRRIIADHKLQGLLKLKPSDELTYFNLQRYMSPHFHKAEKVSA
jgi:chromatin remodeling complex protein RSC6